MGVAFSCPGILTHGSPLTSPFVPGAVLSDRYQLERRVGDDGLIEMWAATDRVLARRVTVEAMAAGAGPDAIAAFGAAAGAAARLIHPGIVATYDSGQADGLPFIVTERSGGPTLAELIRRYGPLHPARVVTIGRQLARALEAAHRTGVVHGGVGAEAVLVTDDDRVKLSRFVTAGTRARLAGNAPAAPDGRRDDVRSCATTLVSALVGEELVPAGPGRGPVRIWGAGPDRDGRSGRCRSGGGGGSGDAGRRCRTAGADAGAPISARALRPGVPGPSTTSWWPPRPTPSRTPPGWPSGSSPWTSRTTPSPTWCATPRRPWAPGSRRPRSGSPVATPARWQAWPSSCC